MLTIRLQRAGKKNKAEFRVVLAKKTSAAQKRVVEILGNYNPHTKALGIRNQDRLNYWIKEQHVEISPTVQNLLISQKMLDATKIKAFSLPKKEATPEVVAEATEAPATEATPEPSEEVTPEQPAETTPEA